jgi:hypothetical protein
LSPKKNIRRKKLGKEIAKFYISADMSDSVKQKSPTQCPCFIGAFLFHMQGIANCKDLLINHNL